MSQGIRLDESEKLIALNESVYADIRTPGSRVYESLKTLGYLEHHSFEEVCKKLSSDDIEKIITEAYGSVSAPEIVSPETPSPTGFLLEKIPPSLLERNISSHYLLGAGVVAGLAGVGYLGYRALRESRASTSPTLAPRENRSLPSSRTLPQTFP